MLSVALSPKARAVIRAHRDCRRPTAVDRERVAAALRARLGAAVLPPDTPTSQQRLMGSGIQRLFATACGLCAVGSVLFLARAPEPALESPARTPDHAIEAGPTATATTPLPSPASASLEAIETPHAEAPIASQHARPKGTRPGPAQDTLSQELRLLTSAASQLSSGQAAGALQALDEHQRRFSHGVLSDERMVAKARALCMLHRFDEGRAALDLLATGTPAAARVKEECDSARARANTANFSEKSDR